MAEPALTTMAPVKVVFTGHLLKAMGEAAVIALISYVLYVVARRLVPARWANDLLEIRYVALVIMFYDFGNRLALGDRATAVKHATWVYNIEIWLGLDWEKSLQVAAQARPLLVTMMNYFYMFSHLPSVIAFFVTIKVCARVHASEYLDYCYLRYRTRFVVMNLLAITIYALFPCAPPRLTKLGIADTIKDRIGMSPYEEIASQVNPYAAMPSMHFGYSWFFTTSLVHTLQLSWLSWRALALCTYPLVMLFSIQATGNHFLLDAVGGFLVVYLAINIQRRMMPYTAKVSSPTLPQYVSVQSLQQQPLPVRRVLQG